uniref:Uncharacterized protein n=1 Tax=uncultured marine virus TaxID=186617 RepID=A0A0F7LA94_9VIRU|nr:hypothetical protein [uncultured marine virus]
MSVPAGKNPSPGNSEKSSRHGDRRSTKSERGRSPRREAADRASRLRVSILRRREPYPP